MRQFSLSASSPVLISLPLIWEWTNASSPFYSFSRVSFFFKRQGHFPPATLKSLDNSTLVSRPGLFGIGLFFFPCFTPGILALRQILIPSWDLLALFSGRLSLPPSRVLSVLRFFQIPPFNLIRYPRPLLGSELTHKSCVAPPRPSRLSFSLDLNLVMTLSGL